MALLLLHSEVIYLQVPALATATSPAEVPTQNGPAGAECMHSLQKAPVQPQRAALGLTNLVKLSSPCGVFPKAPTGWGARAHWEEGRQWPELEDKPLVPKTVPSLVLFAVSVNVAFSLRQPIMVK